MVVDPKEQPAKPDVQSGLTQGKISRRFLMKRAGALGVGASAIALLAACGGGNDNTPSTSGAATTSSTSSASTSTSGGTAQATATKPAATTAAGGAASSPPPPVAGTPVAAPTRATGQAGGVLKFGLLRDPIAFDPHINYGASSASLQGNIYNGLVDYDTAGNIQPSLAEKYEISSDATTYTLKIRQGVTFHNGNPLKADDVVATFDRILNPATKASRAPELANLSNYSATDDFTVKATLKQPYATLLAVLAGTEAYIIDKESAANFDFTKQMNGTGAFKLQTAEPNVRYVLAKNPNYWEKGLPYLDSIEQVPIPDDNARVNAFKSGQINFIEYIPWQNMDELGKDKQFTLYKGFDTYNLVRLNQQKPPLDKAEVRQALNYAIDRKALIDVAFGGQGQAITSGLIPKGTFWYNDELDGTWKYDPEKAKSLLQQVGMKPSDVSLDFLSATISVHQDTAQVVASQLQQLGMKVTLRPQDVPQLTERRSTGDYQLMQDGLSFQWPDPDYYSAYFQTGGAAHAKGVNWSNKEMDDLLIKGRTTIDNNQRKQIYLQFEKLLIQQAPWIFLFFRPQAEAVTANVQGYVRIPGVGLGSERYMQYMWIKK
jgi:ABC-type transport system substrate-binding protein